jgi:hypothetical protein
MATEVATANAVNGEVFDDNDETWIVDPGVTVSSQTDHAFKNVLLADDTLVNLGRVITATDMGGAAVFFDASSGSATVFNAPGATISGARNGIDFEGGGTQHLWNFGRIVGADNVGVYFEFATVVSVVNHGTIFGYKFGVDDNSSSTLGVIDNFGSISAGKDKAPLSAAILIDAAPGQTTFITNEAGALITGPHYAIEATIGVFSLVNHGRIVGNIRDADDANDTIANHGKILGGVYLDGNSTFNGAGGSSGAIHVGTGNATVTGGKGLDHFVFDSALTTQVTDITNFQHGRDKIVLSESDFTGLGVHAIGHVLPAAEFHVGSVATKPSQHIVYDHTDGFLYYDPNGSTGPQFHFATLTNMPTLANTDILVVA